MTDDRDPEGREPQARRRPWQSGAPRGQERFVSYESDERYWTDYLRVAFPVLGLLLMLGLLVWWANSIIGDERGDRPTTPIPSETEIAEIVTSTPTEAPPADLTAETAAVTPTSQAGGNGDDETPAGEDETPADAETEPAADCEDAVFEDGQAVVTTDGVNLREGPSTDTNVITVLEAGVELTVISECFEEAEDGTRFWRVSDDENAQRGYIAEDLLEARAVS